MGTIANVTREKDLHRFQILYLADSRLLNNPMISELDGMYASDVGFHRLPETFPTEEEVKAHQASSPVIDVNFRAILDRQEYKTLVKVQDPEKMPEWEKKRQESLDKIAKKKEKAIEDLKKQHGVDDIEDIPIEFRGPMARVADPYEERPDAFQPQPYKTIQVVGTIVTYWNGLQRIMNVPFEQFVEMHNEYMKTEGLGL